MREVGGSNPSWPLIFFFTTTADLPSKKLKKNIYEINFNEDRSAVVAQLGERQTEDLKVPGSIPGDGIYFFKVILIVNFFYENFQNCSHHPKGCVAQW